MRSLETHFLVLIRMSIWNELKQTLKSGIEQFDCKKGLGWSLVMPEEVV